MKKRILLLGIGLLLLSAGSHSQKSVSFTVNLENKDDGIVIPASLSMEGIGNAKKNLRLFHTNGGGKTLIPHQVSEGKIIWQIDKSQSADYNLFVLEQSTELITAPTLTLSIDSSIRFRVGNNDIWEYHFRTIYPPKGIDTSYKRNGFIHPVRAPHGQLLTRIQPSDHYHHYGLWNPWTRVLFENDTIDFWNLADKKGTVRFVKLLAHESGPVFSSYTVLHEHIITKNARENPAMLERQTVKIYQPHHDDYYIVDFISELYCAGPDPVKLLTYRYGGLGWRATEYWNNQNSNILTSEGLERKDADGSRARWLLVQGELPGGDHGGILFLSHPKNYNHPEPLRVWPENELGRGDVFINISPIKNKDWIIEPGKTYQLQYRMLVFNGTMAAAKAEHTWQNYSKPPVITIIKKN